MAYEYYLKKEKMYINHTLIWPFNEFMLSRAWELMKYLHFKLN